MPSDFISLLSADLDLESPKSLYSKGIHFLLNLFPFLCPTESVYDLLPKELQLPPSRETSVASMSQTSGGEAGSPPPAVVAAGKHSHLFCCLVKVSLGSSCKEGCLILFTCL
uniref:Uncharacterized protein n=1 Tax=Pavo cristatus TaxID=9049 RepID=A0A8C9EHN9_PAVCR